MSRTLLVVCMIVMCLWSELATGGEATVALPFKFREGLLDYKQEVHSRISVAIKFMRSEIEKNPLNVKALYSLAELVSIYNPKEARQHLLEVLKITPKVPEVHFSLGTIAYFEDDFSQAQIHFARAIEVDPQYVFGYNALAFVQGKIGDLQQSVATLRKGLTMVGPRESFYYNLGFIYTGLEDYARGIESLQNAITLNPNDPEYYFMLGNLHAMDQDYLTARTILEKAFDLNPNNAIALLGIAYTFKQENNLEKAIELAEQALKLDPTNSKIAEELAWYKNLKQESQ